MKHDDEEGFGSWAMPVGWVIGVAGFCAWLYFYTVPQ